MAIVALGVVPLLVCLAYCGAQFLPSYQRGRAASWETLLTAQLGLTVKIEAVENRSPVRFALHGVHLVNSENGVSVGRMKEVVVEAHRGQWSVRLIEPEIEASQLTLAWKTIHDWQMCQPKRHSQATHFAMDELIIKGLRKGGRLTKVSAKLLPNQESFWLAISFQTPDSGSVPEITATQEPHASQTSPQSMLIVKRDHRQLSTELQLRTESPIPCSLVSSILPQLEKLGDSATFSGVAGMHVQGGAWRADFTNASFQKVDFGTLTKNTVATVSGIGDIFVNRARLQSNRIDFALGSVMINAGRINGPFLQAIGEHLDVDLRVANVVTSHAFDSVAFSICIQPDGLKLAGQLAGNSIVSDSVGSLASRAAQKWDSQILSLQSLVNVLDAPTRTSEGSTTRLARSALLLLPIENPPQRSANLRLSRTH